LCNAFGVKGRDAREGRIHQTFTTAVERQKPRKLGPSIRRAEALVDRASETGPAGVAPPGDLLVFDLPDYRLDLVHLRAIRRQEVSLPPIDVDE
jgi:hypothetical protein